MSKGDTEKSNNKQIRGYGVVFKDILANPNLSIESKAIYSYLSSYAGPKDTAFPSVELICHELKISEKRFHKYKNDLISLGLLSIQRQRLENGFSKNIYRLENHVTRQIVPLQNDMIRESQQPQLTGQILPLQIVTLQNDCTKNNSLKNNNIYTPGEKSKTKKHKYGEFDNVLLSDDEIEKLKSKFPDDWEKRIEDLSFYIGSKGNKYKNHYMTILSWARKETKQQPITENMLKDLGATPWYEEETNE